MKKRFFALLTAVCIALTTGLTTGLTALADGGENSDMTIGMSTQEQCSCTTLCTEGNINPDCPVCGAEGADLTACKGAPLMMRAAPLAADAPAMLYVGETDIVTGGYWKTTAEGKLEPGSESDYNVYYDGNGTLTLNNATIQGRGYSGNPQPEDYGIYAAPTGNQSVSLTINLMGSNTVSGYCGICVETTTADNASLVIQPAENDPQGSLEAIGNKYNGITISSGSGNASLTINNAPVVAISKSPAPNSYHGVCIKTGIATAPALSLLVNGGSLTAQGESGYGIYFYMRDSTTDPSTSLTVQNNALVKATPSIVTSNNLSKPDTTAGSESGGIVFDGKNGTVYGDVTLQEDLEIGTDETLTIPDGSSLDTNGNLTNSGTIINHGTLTGDVGGSGTVTPKITTDSLSDGTVDTAYNQALTATGNNIKWGVTSGNLPTELRLSEDGKITGTPTTAGTYKFTVTATNNAGSDSKEFTLTIGVAPVYSITAEPLKLDFGTLTEGYTPASQTVTITNNGNQPLTLNEPVSTEHFEVGNLSTLTLPANGTATFTVQPKAGLAAGTYSENIDVTASNNVTLSIPASLTVQKASVPTKPEVPSTGTTSGGSTGESTYPDVEDAQTSYEQATRDFWNRTINKIKKADEGDSLRIYIGIHEEIPGDVIQAIRENGVNVTFYNQDGDEVTVYAESAPTKYQAVWTLKQLGNYVLTEQQTPAAQEESPAAQQPADEPTTPTQPAETEAVDTAKPNPSTGEGSGAVIAMIAAAAALAGLGATLRKR